MQIQGQNNNINTVPQVQYNSAYNCGAAAPASGTSVPAPNVEPPQTTAPPVTQPTYPQGYYYPPTITPPQAPTSGVNIQIFNPAVMPPNGTTNVNSPVYYPGGYYTGQIGPAQPAPIPQPIPQPAPTAPQQPPTQPTPQPPVQTTQTEEAKPESSSKKTEKRKIVMLTDDYIKNLENYLNSQNKAIRLSAAKEVYARLEEDDSRRDDKALNALINKMLQDPADEVRFLALTALDSRLATGDDYTVKVLKQMQQSDKCFGHDATDAASILLKMSGEVAEKEFEVNDKKDEKTKK
ncbi:MAG: hypothetical protein NC191_05780 [Muribaculaceae bacterium]|nr:hypothetical protein [Muribaculaceae bacterium]